MKQKAHQVWLEYPPSLADGPIKGRADCVCRLTAARIIVESGIVTEGKPRLGGLPISFNRHNGMRIPRLSRSWGLAPGERERLNELAEGQS